MRKVLTLAFGALLLAVAAGQATSAAVAAPVAPAPQAIDAARIVQAEWDHGDGDWRHSGEWRPQHPGWHRYHWAWHPHRDWGPRHDYGYGSYDRGWRGPRDVW
jgi:hypothetical protein